ncbi:macrophage mannose receptor 1-like [Garra rufa]|uniref:macrophage mannose receptor 1-like n=1 Tax=Garra rufa TaxID=137080 RepID=UPI003CCE894B
MGRSLFVLLLSGLFWSSSAFSRPYHYINARMSWSEAQSYCRYRFTDLATVDNMDELNRLVKTADTGYSGSVWIGLKRGKQKRWGWSNGEDTTSQYYNWGPSQPNGNEECVTYYSGAWHDMYCDNSLYFVCYNENTGYIMVQRSETWRDAQSYCRQHYTDLPTIHNSEENNQIVSQIIMNYGWYVWIGMFQDSWEWSDKSSLFFRHWAAGQPSQNSGSGDCVGMTSTDSGKWVHKSCDLQQPFICHGGDKLIKKQIVRMKLSCNGKCTLNDPSLQMAILNEISEKLKNMGLEGEISWRKSEGGEVFHPEGSLNKKKLTDSNLWP